MFLYAVQCFQALIVCFGVIKGHGIEGRHIIIVFVLIKGDALNSFYIAQFIIQVIGLIQGDVCHHHLCRTVGGELFRHHIQALS